MATESIFVAPPRTSAPPIPPSHRANDLVHSPLTRSRVTCRRDASAWHELPRCTRMFSSGSCLFAIGHFDIRALYIPMSDRSTWRQLVRRVAPLIQQAANEEDAEERGASGDRRGREAAREGAREVTVMAESFGACLALRIAAANPGLLHRGRLVLVSEMHFLLRCLPFLLHCLPFLLRCLHFLLRCLHFLLRCLPFLLRCLPFLLRCLPFLLRLLPPPLPAFPPPLPAFPPPLPAFPPPLPAFPPPLPAFPPPLPAFPPPLPAPRVLFPVGLHSSIMHAGPVAHPLPSLSSPFFLPLLPPSFFGRFPFSPLRPCPLPPCPFAPCTPLMPCHSSPSRAKQINPATAFPTNNPLVSLSCPFHVPPRSPRSLVPFPHTCPSNLVPSRSTQQRPSPPTTRSSASVLPRACLPSSRRRSTNSPRTFAVPQKAFIRQNSHSVCLPALTCQDVALPLLVKRSRVQPAAAAAGTSVGGGEASLRVLSPIDYVPAACASWRLSLLNDQSGLSDAVLRSIHAPTLLVGGLLTMVE
ncbi:unnamed protein product [Closterium sp. Naga37s-1]|nr:unnamed protein product [Closterium sp. Naga37s-1]